MYNAKINDIEDKISDLTNLATNTALNAIETKIPDNSKYTTTPEFNKLTAENVALRVAQSELASKNDIANFTKKD